MAKLGINYKHVFVRYTDEVVRTMAEARGMGEGLQAANLLRGCGGTLCLLQAPTRVEKEKNWAQKGWGMGGQDPEESEEEEEDPSQQQSNLRALKILTPPEHHSALCPTSWPCSFSSVPLR